ncbi:outer membrane protein [Sphingobium fluviale]|uniref:Opacity protein n=1 Tax=Sphingobium fluviale TaxID=2506423 RepID=A0A4Q1KIR8_9SPHN|nr:opacity protein [Sphingobium fluviale]RXR29492.1 opacity protein [Sphingobium fluviale]
MKTLLLAALGAASLIPATAYAQNDGGDDGVPTNTRFQPYFGVMGGYEDFDSEPNNLGIPGSTEGGIVEGVVGANFDLGPLTLGAEGNVAKGFTGDIDWEYGAAGRVGIRAGKDSMFFGKVGYRWVNLDSQGINGRDHDGWTYGGGVELSPVDVGLQQGDNSNIRLRLQVDTMGNFRSIRPMAGLVAKF